MAVIWSVGRELDVTLACMSTYPPDEKVRPSAAWYLLPLALWLAALILAVIAWKPVATAITDGVDTVANNAPLSVPSGGVTVYASQQVNGGSCAVIDGSGQATQLSGFSADGDWNIPNGDRGTFYGLGSTPSDLPAGTYTLRCTGLAPNATLGTGPRIDIGDVGRIAILGIAVPALLGLIGLIILIVLLVKRHNSKSRMKLARASAGSGYPGGWSGGSGYPPPPPSGP
jgi:hypothetical protein